MVRCLISRSDDPMDQIKDCLNIVADLNTSLTQGSTLLDMSDLNWVSPFAALILSNRILNLKGNIKIKPPTNLSVRSYLTSIGFPMGSQDLGSTYCPIHHVKGEIASVANKVIKVVNDNFPDTLKGNIVGYLIAEFCDNINEHSKFTNASIMAQYYKSKNMADVGFIDNGISIPKNFELKNINFNDDHNAIDMALQGISTKVGETRGFGLPTSRKLINEGLNGELYIISRGGALKITKDIRKFYKLEGNQLIGTLGYMRFLAPKNKLNVYKYID